MKRLAPADFQNAVSQSAARRASTRDGYKQLRHHRSESALRDGDLHKVFKPGRELVFVHGDGTVSRRALRPAEAKNAKVLLGVVKMLAAGRPHYIVEDQTLLKKLGGKRAGWSLSTVRRTRRVIAAAGVDVRPLIGDGALGERAPDFRGFVWSLDRRTIPCLDTGVVTAGSPIRVHERENPVVFDSPPPPRPDSSAERAPPELVLVDGSQSVTEATAWAAPPHAPPQRMGETPPRRRWRRRRGDRSSADAAHPDVADDVRDEAALLIGLVRERWKVTDRWGIAAALSAAEQAAIAAGADPVRVAVARRRIAFELLGEQLALDDADGGPDHGG